MPRLRFSLILSMLCILACLDGCSAPSPRRPVQKTSQLPPAVATAPVRAADSVTEIPAAPQPVIIDTLLDDYARFLAGIVPARYFLRLAGTQAWVDYSRRTKADWSAVKSNKLEKIASWVGANPDLARVRGTLFYPFAGADFLFANAYFPACDTIIMVGLEPAGSLLELNAMRDETCSAFLNKLNASLSYVNRLGFFITKKMKASLWREDLNGTLPLILFYIKRCGFQLSGLEHVTLDTAGKAVVTGRGSGRKYSAIRISYTDSTRTERRAVYYFSFNLSNSAANTHREFYRFASSCGPFSTLIKSASYLMHNRGNFSVIRSFILQQSQVLLQDDSGIPYKEFLPTCWALQLHGAYSRTLRIFRENFQKDLSIAYSQRARKNPLPFKLGYNASLGETNLQVAVRR